MAVDTPARIAVIGAGPIGIEAALYARYLGYDVDLYERGRVCEHLLRQGHETPSDSFGQIGSSLGCANLKLQDASWAMPAASDSLNNSQLVERYYGPLSQSDMLADSLRLGVEVLHVGRRELLKGDLPNDDTRADSDFHLIVRGSGGDESAQSADVVIDCSGVEGNPRWLGRGGLPAIGEVAVRSSFQHGVPDLSDGNAAQYADNHTLLIGSGLAAASTIVRLAELAKTHSATRVTWLTRCLGCEQLAPISVVGLASSAQIDLANMANTLAAEAAAPDVSSRIEHLPGMWVESIRQSGSGFGVSLSGEATAVRKFDNVVANVGFRPDWTFLEELQISRSPSSDGPSRIAEALLDPVTGQRIAERRLTAADLIQPEPDFYVLGAKSLGRISRFTIHEGLDQTRLLFTIIGDREGLDLYRTLGIAVK